MWLLFVIPPAYLNWLYSVFSFALQLKFLKLPHSFIPSYGGGTEKSRKHKKEKKEPVGRGRDRHSITKQPLLINKEIKDILIKDIFPCLSNASAATVHMIFKCWKGCIILSQRATHPYKHKTGAVSRNTHQPGPAHRHSIDAKLH